MRSEAIFLEVLRQALASSEERVRVGRAPRTEEAHQLGDELYRLCIEFGLPWNEFRRIALDHLVADATDSPIALHLADVLGARLPLVLFALEVMPADAEI